MGYRVIHLIEAAYWLDDLEYSQLVEQCEHIYSGLTADENCSGQICMTISDRVRTIPSEDGWWPGEAAFRRPRFAQGRKICFEEALNATSEHMQEGEMWAVILYTAGGIRRPKRTMLHKWKKKLWIPLLLLAVKTVHADSRFLESYTEGYNVFPVGMSSDVIEKVKGYGKTQQAREFLLPVWKEMEEKELSLEDWEEVWELIRKRVGTLL